MRMAKTLRATVTMRQEPMSAVVSCRSRTKSNAWPEALGPSSWFSSRALITSHGSSRQALAPPGQGHGCQPPTVSVCHQRLRGRAVRGGACRSSGPAGGPAGETEQLKASSFVPRWHACPPRGPRGLPTTSTKLKPSARPRLPALSALAPAALPSAILVSLPDLCTCRVLPCKRLRSSLPRVNIHSPFRV